MSSIIRAAIVYLVLLVIFRVAGKRTLSETTTFDLVMLLIISEAVQQALIGDDNSMTNAFLLVITLVGLDILLSLLARSSSRMNRLLEGLPLVLVRRGAPIAEHLRKERVDEAEILEEARRQQGLRRMDEIDYAVLERSGRISVVPRSR